MGGAELMVTTSLSQGRLAIAAYWDWCIHSYTRVQVCSDNILIATQVSHLCPD